MGESVCCHCQSLTEGTMGPDRWKKQINSRPILEFEVLPWWHERTGVLGFCLLHWKGGQSLEDEQINKKKERKKKKQTWKVAFFSLQIILQCINSISMFIKAWRNKMCDVKLANSLDISYVAWWKKLFPFGVRMRCDNIFFLTGKHPGTWMCSELDMRNILRKSPHHAVLRKKRREKKKRQCSFNALIHQVAPLRMSWDSIVAAFQYFQSLYSASRLCSRSRQNAWWEGGRRFVRSQRGSVRSARAEAASRFFTSFSPRSQWGGQRRLDSLI